MRLRILLSKLFSGLPFHSRHLFAVRKVRKSSLQYWLVHQCYSSTLSPCLYRQIHPQLLNTQHNVCSAVFIPILQGFSVLFSMCLKKANTQMALAAKSSPWTAKPGLQGTCSPPERSHTRSTTYHQANTKIKPQGTAKYCCLIVISFLNRGLLPDLPAPRRGN